MKKYVDLTHPISEKMLTYPAHWHPTVEFKQMGRLEIEGRSTSRLTLGTHTGTHCDAPAHFIHNGKTVDQIPLSQLMGAARLIDLTHLPELSAVTPKLLQEILGSGEAPERIVFRFGWDSRFGTSDFYKLHPFFSMDAARWIVEAGVRLIGLDTPSPDNPKPNADDGDSPVHKIFFKKEVILVEYLRNLSFIHSQEFDLYVLPLLLEGGDGAPARCVAVFEEEE